MDLQFYDNKWTDLYKSEQEALKILFDDELIDIQHIGSTAIPSIQAKPIIDIVILLQSFEGVDHYLEKLRKLNYEYSPECSSSERYFFIKGDPIQYHLSITNPKTLYMQRQIVFRDYLINHPDIAKEYEVLKVDLIKKYPLGRDKYSYGKNEFINKILKIIETTN